MGWVIVDDFESGVLSGNWEGDTSWLAVVSDTSLKGAYTLRVDSDGVGYSTDYLESLRSEVVSRNSAGEKTLRYLSGTPGDDKSFFKSHGMIFLATDLANHYCIEHTTDYGGNTDIFKLIKTIAGVRSELATIQLQGGTPRTYGIELKIETNLITAYFYQDTDFIIQTTETLSTSDTTFTTGKIGVCEKSSYADDQGILTRFRWDNIEIWEEAAPATEIPKIKIAGTFASKPVFVKIGGTFVEKTMKVKVGGVFQ